MSTSKPSVLIAGPNGTVGSSVVNAILKRKDKFHNLGFLVNEDAPRYDFLKKQGLSIEFKDASDLKGKYDILFIAINASAAEDEIPLIDLAIEAGIKTVYPSEFGIDVEESGAQFVAPKVKVRQYLESKHKEGHLDYVLIVANLFFDWGLDFGFWSYNLPNKEATIFNGGNTKISGTYVPDLGELIVDTFFDKSARNKQINATSFVATQQEVLKELEKQSGSKWIQIDESLDQYGLEAAGLFAKGDFVSGLQHSLLPIVYSEKSSKAFNALEPYRNISEFKVHTLQQIVSKIISKT